MTWSKDAGIPIGTEFIGRNGEEHDLLALAAQLPAEINWISARLVFWFMEFQ
jgi:Asp-tRNA(Asn)/Glu-tRNA(Gln) amidotransferase A subunit family amidase